MSAWGTREGKRQYQVSRWLSLKTHSNCRPHARHRAGKGGGTKPRQRWQCSNPYMRTNAHDAVQVLSSNRRTVQDVHWAASYLFTIKKADPPVSPVYRSSLGAAVLGDEGAHTVHHILRKYVERSAMRTTNVCALYGSKNNITCFANVFLTRRQLREARAVSRT